VYSVGRDVSTDCLPEGRTVWSRSGARQPGRRWSTEL